MPRILWAGCIIWARLRRPLREAYEKQPDLPNLMQADRLASVLEKMAPGWRRTVAVATRLEIPAPVFSAELPQNLTRVQRDAFGAHSYQRRDRPEAGFVHSDWS